MKVKDFIKILVDAGLIEGDTNVENIGDLQIYLHLPREDTVEVEALIPLQEVAEVKLFTKLDGKTQLILYFPSESGKAEK